MHAVVPICAQSGMQACASCPTERIQQGAVVLIDSDSQLNQFKREDVLKSIPNAVFTDIPVELYGSLNYEPSGLCTVHGYGGGFGQAYDDRANAVAAAQALIDEINAYLQSETLLSELQRSTLFGLVSSLKSQMLYGDSASIEAAVSSAQASFDAIRSQQGTAAPETPAPPETSGPDAGGDYADGGGL